MKKYKICVVTGTRAEYGLLKNIIYHLHQAEDVDFRLVVTGTHLCTEFGYTLDEITDDGFIVDEKIECVVKIDDDSGMIHSVSRAMDGFAEYFLRRRPDMLIILGDRYEIFACASAAAIYKIPISHLYGGDTTEGAIDEFFRHAITKMSYLHFVSNENSRQRVVQLGEHPNRVFNVGATGAENVLNMKLLSKKQLESEIGFELDIPYGIVTFHPVTMEINSAEAQVKELFAALEHFNNMKFIFTKANADGSGRKINALIDEFVYSRENYVAYESLGVLRYLSAVKYARMVIGNSSSGIYEVPLFGISTINIGDRQRGRLQGDSVINCKPKKEEIIEALEEANKSNLFNVADSPYFKCGTSENVVKKVIETVKKENIDLKKKFYDMEISKV